jgi:hypothetical protein
MEVGNVARYHRRSSLRKRLTDKHAGGQFPYQGNMRVTCLFGEKRPALMFDDFHLGAQVLRRQFDPINAGRFLQIQAEAVGIFHVESLTFLADGVPDGHVYGGTYFPE